MELLILLLLVGWGTARYGANGALAHARKTEPLRIAERRQRAAQTHERRMARAARRTGPTLVDAISMRIADRIAKPRGGPAREAFALWWSDSWGYATERRQLRHERAAHGHLGRQKAARAAKDWLTRVAARRRAQRATNATQDPFDQGGRVWGEAEVIPDEQDIVDAEVVDDESAATTATATGMQPDESDEAPTSESSVTDPNPAAEPQHHQHDTDANMASVHPIRKEPEMTSTTTSGSPSGEHTVSSGEILDPAAGLSFVNGVGGVAQRLVTEIDLSLASLRQRGVSGEEINLLTQMQEAAQVLSANSTQAAGHFERHLGVQDQVLSDPSLAGTVENTYLGTRS